MTTNKNHAQKWFDAGLSTAGKFLAAWRNAKGYVCDAGLLFMKARETCQHGDWGAMLQDNALRIKPRTVQFYIQITEAALVWAREANPELPDSKLPAAAREVMMMSPKPLVALLRDLREMRPFGEYDAVKYAQRKGLGNGQIEFNFCKLVASFDALEHIGDANCVIELPEGTDEKTALREIEGRLERATLRVRERLQTIDV